MSLNKRMELGMLNRSEYYTEITKAMREYDHSKVKAWMRKTFNSDRFDRLDLHQLGDLLAALKNGEVK